MRGTRRSSAGRRTGWTLSRSRTRRGTRRTKRARNGSSTSNQVKCGRNCGFLKEVLPYLVQSKDSFGTWESTQGTVWSMKSLLYAGQNGSGGKGTVTVMANGKKAASFKITEEDSDVMRQVSLAE